MDNVMKTFDDTGAWNLRWLKTANTSASCPRARYSTRTAASSAITARTDPGMFVAQYASQP